MEAVKYVSKTDFKAARECPTKLYYRKNKYPNTKENDEFLELLAEGGFMVGKMAQLLFPDGIEIPAHRDNPREAIAQTMDYLSQESVTLFEPAIFANGMLIRADVLVKRGSTFDLIEVKAKSISETDSTKRDAGGTVGFWKKRGEGLDSGWQPYLEDVAYQTFVLKRAFPGSEIRPFLLLCDKGKFTGIDNLLQQFILRRHVDERGNESTEVEFTGDLEGLRRDHVLIQIDTSREVEYLLPEVEAAALELVASVLGAEKIQGPLRTGCKKCEYRMPAEQKDKNGFLECWGPMGSVSPHLLELRNLGNIKVNGEKLADSLFARGLASLNDFPVDSLGTGSQAIWQARQIEYTRRNEEWVSPDLGDLLKQHRYPLQFIDFETSRMALPYHSKMRPYGQVAFQWSCHTVEAPGATPQHREWINTSDVFPNVEFARTLMECLGQAGTVFMWSHHEKSVLGDILTYIREADLPLPRLIGWLEWINDHLVDQCKIAENHYYHPHMKGSVSIKYVLPAIWNNNPYLHDVSYLKPFFKKAGEQVLSPYEALEKIEIAEEAEVVSEGTGAMRAYQQMMYGLYRGDQTTHQKWTDLLTQYCALDTMAMVIIYKHWCSRTGVEF